MAKYEPRIYKQVLRAYKRVVADPMVPTREIYQAALQRYNDAASAAERMDIHQHSSIMATLHQINHIVSAGRKPKGGLYNWDQEMRELFPYNTRVIQKRRGRNGKRNTGELRKGGVAGLVVKTSADGKAAPGEDVMIMVTLKGRRVRVDIEGPVSLLPRLLKGLGGE